MFNFDTVSLGRKSEPGEVSPVPGGRPSHDWPATGYSWPPKTRIPTGVDAIFEITLPRAHDPKIISCALRIAK